MLLPRCARRLVLKNPPPTAYDQAVVPTPLSATLPHSEPGEYFLLTSSLPVGRGVAATLTSLPPQSGPAIRKATCAGHLTASPIRRWSSHQPSDPLLPA